MTSHTSGRLIGALGGIGFLCALAAGATWAIDVHARRQAESLLKELKNIQIGRSTRGDIEPIIRSFPQTDSHGASSDCPDADQSYGFRVASDPMSRLGLAHPFLRKIGLRPWGGIALVLLRHGAVCFVEYSIETTTGIGDKELIASAQIGSAQNPLLDGQRYHVRGSLVRGRLDTMDAIASGAATDEERRHALDFDLSCLTAFRGCQSHCELMPSAWLDYMKERRANGWSLPSDATENSHCRSLTAEH